MQIASYSSEINISIAAQIIALVTTLFVLYQARLVRIHNRLSVRPHLAIETFCVGQDKMLTVEIRLSNNGLGPAIIKRHSVYFDGRRLGGSEDIISTRSVMHDIFVSLGSYSTAHGVFARDTALIAGAERYLIKFEFVEGKGLNRVEFSQKFLAAIGRFDADIEYECMYGFKHRLDTRLLSPAEKA